MADTGMKDHVYKILDLVGSSEKSIEDAVQNAVTRASKTIREMKWFEIVQTRGHIENGTVRHYHERKILKSVETYKDGVLTGREESAGKGLSIDKAR